VERKAEARTVTSLLESAPTRWSAMNGRLTGGTNSRLCRHGRGGSGRRAIGRVSPADRLPFLEENLMAPGANTTRSARPSPAKVYPACWLVDAINRTLEAFDLHDGQWLLIASAKALTCGDRCRARLSRARHKTTALTELHEGNQDEQIR